jgi:2,6-dioxo-6-phenylhexa-3-enoate hydrolase
MRALVHDESRVSNTLIDEWWSNEQARPSPAPQPAMFYEVSADLPKVGHDTLVIRGWDDRFSAPDSAFVLLRRMRSARVHLFPKSGHFAHWENASEFNGLVSTFLSVTERHG